MNFAAVLLCGGRSTRMGRDKALIEWGGMPLWQFQMRTLLELDAERVLVSCREEQGLCGPFEFIFDPPGSDDGPLGALTRCLERVRMRMLVLAVDMPWMTAEFLRAEVLQGGFFRGAHGLEALCAVYDPVMLPVMQRALDERRLSLQRVIEECHPVVRSVGAEQAAFFRNANSPEELDG